MIINVNRMLKSLNTVKKIKEIFSDKDFIKNNIATTMILLR